MLTGVRSPKSSPFPADCRRQEIEEQINGFTDYCADNGREDEGAEVGPEWIGRLRGETHYGAADEARTCVCRPLESGCTITIAPREELWVAKHRRGSNAGGGEGAEQNRCKQGRTL